MQFSEQTKKNDLFSINNSKWILGVQSLLLVTVYPDEQESQVLGVEQESQLLEQTKNVRIK